MALRPRDRMKLASSTVLAQSSASAPKSPCASAQPATCAWSGPLLVNAFRVYEQMLALYSSRPQDAGDAYSDGLSTTTDTANKRRSYDNKDCDDWDFTGKDYQW